MKWLIRIVGAVVLLGALTAIVGWLLPVKHEASRSAEFARTPNEVYALVSDYKNYVAWWPDITRIEVLGEEAGKATFREHMADGPIVMSVVEQSPPSRFVTKIVDAGQPFGGTWTFEINPVNEGRTRLTITERGEIYNPIFRALARFVFGYMSTMESFLQSADRRLRVRSE
ncbi:MAG: SRPBCC family protein [Acidobacteriota bacterium]|nr:SRPBCC family protein [Acidobacteriota bacterium]